MRLRAPFRIRCGEALPPHAGSPVQTIRSDKGCCSGVFPNSALPQGPSYDCDRPSFAANNRHFPSVQKPAFLHRAQCCRTRPVSVTILHLEPGLIRQPTLSRSRCEPDRRRSDLRLQGPADWRLSEFFYNHQTNLCAYLFPIRPRSLSCSGKRANSGKRAFKKPTQTASAAGCSARQSPAGSAHHSSRTAMQSLPRICRKNVLQRYGSRQNRQASLPAQNQSQSCPGFNLPSITPSARHPKHNVKREPQTGLAASAASALLPTYRRNLLSYKTY